MFFKFEILAAAMGTVFENSARSRTAPAERTIGGRRNDIESETEATLGSYIPNQYQFCGCLLSRTSIVS